MSCWRKSYWRSSGNPQVEVDDDLDHLVKKRAAYADSTDGTPLLDRLARCNDCRYTRNYDFHLCATFSPLNCNVCINSCVGKK